MSYNRNDNNPDGYSTFLSHMGAFAIGFALAKGFFQCAGWG